jgi:hypothetical protein
MKKVSFLKRLLCTHKRYVGTEHLHCREGFYSLDVCKDCNQIIDGEFIKWGTMCEDTRKITEQEKKDLAIYI